jgi:dihydroorotate dehydrogenase
MPFEEPDALHALLSSVQQLSLQEPVFLKCSADLTMPQADALMDTAAKFEFVKGLIFCNLTKDRASPSFDRGEIANLTMKGGISGRAVGPKSLRLLSHAFRRHGRRFVLVGCGGIFTAEDAYARIRAGASLIQVCVVTCVTYIVCALYGVRPWSGHWRCVSSCLLSLRPHRTPHTAHRACTAHST